jgi:hypothetical protein
LHQLGLDPHRLTYFYAGLDQRLIRVTEVEPNRHVIGGSRITEDFAGFKKSVMRKRRAKHWYRCVGHTVFIL